MKPVLLLLFLASVSWLPAQDLGLLFPARTIDVGVSSDAGALAFEGQAFTGDYPYRFRAGRDQLAWYTGIPLYFPLMGSLGSVSQVGYKDDYSIATPLAVLTAGYQSRLGILSGAEGPFFLWGFRWEGWAGGAAFEPGPSAWSGGLGWFGPWGGLATTGRWASTDLRPTEAEAKVRWSLPGAWSLWTASRWAPGGWTWSLGLGTYLYEAPANALARERWDHLVAHRGTLLRAPENTRPAVELALREGQVKGVELDVQRTSDGTYAFVHDDFLFRYTGTLERVVSLSGKDLANRDLGRWFGKAFAGTRPMVLDDLGPLAEKAPANLWVFDLKNIGTTPADAQAFLDAVDRTVPGSPALVSTGDLALLASLRPLSRHPLGLQVDVARVFFLWGDLFPPVLEAELDALVPEGVGSFFLFSSKAAHRTALDRVAQRRGLTYYLWNFHDRIYGRDAGPAL